MKFIKMNIILFILSLIQVTIAAPLKANDIAVEYVGVDAGAKGSIIGMQISLTTSDYRNENIFLLKMDRYLRYAQQNNMLEKDNIVVFPEYVGTWLVAADEQEKVYSAEKVTDAMLPIVIRHIPKFLIHYLGAKGSNKLQIALFKSKAQRMADIYVNVFSQLAKKYHITLVAGSIILPNPQVIGGRIKVKNGPLTNSSFVFDPMGRLYSQITKKQFPTQEEQTFLVAGAPKDVQAYETPLGKLSVLICADSWFPQSYQRISDLGSEILAVPSFSTPKQLWDSPWLGYSGYPNPSDVDETDLGTISEYEAWMKYAMLGRIKEAPAIKYAINPFMHGQLWDMSLGGHTFYSSPLLSSETAFPDQETITKIYIH